MSGSVYNAGASWSGPRVTAGAPALCVLSAPAERGGLHREALSEVPV